MATVKVQKLGNSLAVQIPDSLVKELGLVEGSVVEVSAASDATHPRRPRFELAELLNRIQPENRHDETNWGPPVGKEIW